jgi:uncharacterized protein YycO
LDAKLIPGFWNHAGFYAGDNKVIHALSQGVVSETLFDFCKTDHVVILRPGFNYDREATIIAAENAVGHKYDFAFDFECSDKFSCTELILHLFKDCEHGIQPRSFLWKDTIVAADDIKKANFNPVVTIVNK